MRRDFDLLAEDAAFLDECGFTWESIADGSQWVLINDFPLPSGYTETHATAAVRLESGYPDAQLDMVYFHPAIVRRDRQPIGATNNFQAIDGRQFQRWSRHRTAQNPWIAGQDSLATHIMLVEDWLEREFEQ